MRVRVWVLAGLWVLSGAVSAGLLESGQKALQQQDYDQAYDLLTRAFRENPADREVNLTLGRAAFKKQKYSHAVFAYDRVLMTDPENRTALYGKAQAVQRLGQQAEARTLYMKLLTLNPDPEMQQRIEETVREMDQAAREVKLKGELSIAAFYDDNINFGPSDDNLVAAANTEEDAWGLELGAGVRAEYDVGLKGDWTAVGSARMLNSWHDSASAQELQTTKITAGARKLEQRNLYEAAARFESVVYGHDRLVEIYAADGAWLHAKTKDDYLISRMTLEHRDYDDGVDPDNDRDSIYLRIGETWKHFFENRRNTVSVGADLFMEETKRDFNSNNGFRLRAEGERELPGGVIGYAGARYRLSHYEENTGNNPVREDDRYDLIFGARKRVAENCTLDLRHQYIRNDSTIGVSDYTRNRTMLTAVFEF